MWRNVPHHPTTLSFCHTHHTNWQSAPIFWTTFQYQPKVSPLLLSHSPGHKTIQHIHHLLSILQVTKYLPFPGNTLCPHMAKLLQSHATTTLPYTHYLVSHTEPCFSSAATSQMTCSSTSLHDAGQSRCLWYIKHYRMMPWTWCAESWAIIRETLNWSQERWTLNHRGFHHLWGLYFYVAPFFVSACLQPPAAPHTPAVPPVVYSPNGGRIGSWQIARYPWKMLWSFPYRVDYLF